MDSIKNRKPTRLKEFDDSNGAFYYVTICTKNREEFFGKIENETMVLHDYGNIANQFWIEIPKHFPNCVIDEFIIMPNHIHGILIIDQTVGNANLRSEKTKTMDVGNAYMRSENKKSEQLGNADMRSENKKSEQLGNADMRSLRIENIFPNQCRTPKVWHFCL